jgi:hypothetical protein
MARLPTFFGFSTKMRGRSRLTLTVAGVGILGLLAVRSFVLLPTQGAEQVNGHRTAAPTLDRVRNANNHDTSHRESESGDEPEDNRIQVHTNHAEPLGEQAYKDAPADVVLWGDLARALVVRKGSAYQAKFLPPVLALDGKTISIIGYVTPVLKKDTPGKQFLLSSHAFLCDECDPPSPTELVEVNTRDFVLAKDGVATIRGRFEVVKSDPKGLAYRLNEAIILKQQAH